VRGCSPLPRDPAAPLLLDDADVDAAPGEVTREGQPGRPGADDEYLCLVHGDTVPAAAVSPPTARCHRLGCETAQAAGAVWAAAPDGMLAA
jgi:hypothetical protein